MISKYNSCSTNTHFFVVENHGNYPALQFESHLCLCKYKIYIHQKGPLLLERFGAIKANENISQSFVTGEVFSPHEMLTCDGISYKITVIICIQSGCFLLCCSWAAYHLIEKNVRYHYFAQSGLDALYILPNKYIHYVFYNMEIYCLVFPFLYARGLCS